MSTLLCFVPIYCNRREKCFNGFTLFPVTGPEVFTWEQAGGEESRPSVRSARDSEGDPGQNSKLPNGPPGETHRHTDALTVCCECERHPHFTTPALCCTVVYTA